jgi:hypothetical protein
MRRPGRTRLRRDSRALDIIELLAAHPAGLTVIEIASRLDCPAPEVVRTLALMQRRQWLRTGGERKAEPESRVCKPGMPIKAGCIGEGRSRC